MLLSVLFCLISPAAWAAGEACTSDADCSEGEECVFAMTEVACPPCREGEDCPPCGEGDDSSEDVDGVCYDSGGGSTPGPPSELLCETDADCGLGLICEEQNFGCPPTAASGSGASSSSGGLPQDAPDNPEKEPAGFDVDCSCDCDPDDSECVEDCDCGGEDMKDGSDSGEGEEEGVPEWEEMEVNCEEEYVKVCTLETGNCESDADCLDGFVCDEIQSCMSIVSAACTCAEDEEDCDCMEEPSDSEEVCEVVDSFCRPALVACGEGEEACPEGWVCVDLPEDSQEEEGMESSCLPEGWDVLLEAESGVPASGEVGTDLGVFSGSGDDQDASPASPSDDSSNTAGEPPEESEESKGGSSSSGLCSAGSSSSSGWPLLLLLFGFIGILANRRERRQI